MASGTWLSICRWATNISTGGSRGGARGPASLYLDQTEARSAEKMFFFRPPPLSQGEGLDDTPPPPPKSEGVDPPLHQQRKSCPRGREVGGDTRANYLGVSVRSHPKLTLTNYSGF